jgi:DNA-binding GntR family transcriptional regulator
MLDDISLEFVPTRPRRMLKLAPGGLGQVSAPSRQSLPEVICAALREAIVSGALVPGQLLRQEELASRFQASRVPLREALQQLQAEGLVMLRPRRGYVVATLDGRQLFEILQLRILVEGHAGYVAALNRTATDVKALQSCIHAMDRLPLTGLTPAQVSRWSLLNQQFHDILIAAADCPHLKQIAGNLRSKIEAYIRMEIAFVDCLGEAHADHHEIFAAFQRGDAARVSILCRLHAEATAKRFVQALSARGLVNGLPDRDVTNLGPAAILEPDAARVKAKRAG